LIVTDNLDENLMLASRNLYKVDVCTPAQLNPVALVGNEKVLVTAEAVKQIEGMLA
jgi:large subunit ribosomal protein L4